MKVKKGYKDILHGNNVSFWMILGAAVLRLVVNVDRVVLRHCRVRSKQKLEDKEAKMKMLMSKMSPATSPWGEVQKYVDDFRPLETFPNRIFGSSRTVRL